LKYFSGLFLGLIGCLLLMSARAEGLYANRLGVIFDLDDAHSRRIAAYYAEHRDIPPSNVIGIHVPHADVWAPEDFPRVRSQLLDALPTQIESLLLVWSRPYAVGCMSVTTAFAAGYHAGFCVPGCARTIGNPLFDSSGWLPAETVDWYPSMLLPSDDEDLARRVIQRGVQSDLSAPPGIVYLMRTADWARSVRATTYDRVMLSLQHLLAVVRESPPTTGEIPAAIGYFTGAKRVDELARIEFRPGALADHLTSSGGKLDGFRQMPAVAWLAQGATASYGTVSEPCNYLGKFPDIAVLFEHYRHGETALEAYWKSVAMPGQGLFIGEPLARPYPPEDPR
jgi:uncharacterized protein (TIGR03790 family)